MRPPSVLILIACLCLPVISAFFYPLRGSTRFQRQWKNRGMLYGNGVELQLRPDVIGGYPDIGPSYETVDRAKRFRPKKDYDYAQKRRRLYMRYCNFSPIQCPFLPSK